MTNRSFLLPVAAALTLGAGTARAQHDMQHMGHDMVHTERSKPPPSKNVTPIAEGTLKDGVRTVEVAVTEGGFEPSRIKANKGEKVRLVVTRKTNSTCAKEIVIEHYRIHEDLPLEKAVTVEFAPKESGEIRYACAMNHVSGVVFVP